MAAIEDAGLVLDFEKGTDLGVFVGISHNDYQVIQGTHPAGSGASVLRHLLGEPAPAAGKRHQRRCH